MILNKLTLPELLKNSCSQFKDNLSLNFVQSGNRTYRDFYNEVLSISNHLLELGIRKGDKVAILSANMPNWGITQFAIAQIGAIAVPVLPGFSTTEIQNILEHSEAKIIFVSKLLYKLVADIKTNFLEHKILMNTFAHIPAGYPVEDIEKLEQLIQGVGPENIPLIFTCITNNPICGQPVSMGNIKEINRVAHKYNIPLVFDVARWAENCYFIKMNEEGYQDKSIAEIASEMFSYCDAFTMSAKKDGHANMGGMLAFRDRGLFWKNFSDFNEDGSIKTDVGVLLKVKQISCYGNDSYGGMSGRDIMALAVGLYESCDFNYMHERVQQCEYLAQGFYKNGVKGVVLPAGGHAVYINMDEFFDVLHEEPLDQWYEIGNVIAVVDARLEDTLSPEAEYLLASQAANAGCMILSKCDTATEEQRQNTIAHLKRSLAALGCKQRADQKILCEGAELFSDQDFAAILSCGYYIASYEKPDFAKGQAFESLYFLDMHLDGDAVTAAVKKMLKDPACGHIFRVKGFLQNPDGTWLEINATQQEITRKPIANGQDVLIVIGENLVEDAIREYWKG